jgi:hypothetical protein
MLDALGVSASASFFPEKMVNDLLKVDDVGRWDLRSHCPLAHNA